MLHPFAKHIHMPTPSTEFPTTQKINTRYWTVFSPGFTGQRAQVIIHDHAPHLAHAAPLCIYAMPLNSCFACCAIRRTLAARVLLSIMPPKGKAKKPKLVAGQKTLSFAQGSEPSTALPLESAVSSLSTVPRGWDMLGTPSSRRGAVASWRAFAAAKWRNKHLWIVVEDDGVYCLYCKAGTGLWAALLFSCQRLLQVRDQIS